MKCFVRARLAFPASDSRAARNRARPIRIGVIRENQRWTRTTIGQFFPLRGERLKRFSDESAELSCGQ